MLTNETYLWCDRSEGFENFVIVAIGSLSDPTIGSPTFSVYSSETRKHAWVKLPDGIEAWD